MNPSVLGFSKSGHRVEFHVAVMSPPGTSVMLRDEWPCRTDEQLDGERGRGPSRACLSEATEQHALNDESGISGHPWVLLCNQIQTPVGERLLHEGRGPSSAVHVLVRVCCPGVDINGISFTPECLRMMNQSRRD